MEKIKILFSSKAFWSIATVGIIEALKAMLPLIANAHIALIIQIILAGYAMYQHPTEAKQIAETGFLGSMRVPKY